jgi:glycosyltransferase involved in cell wall biosynthesis
MFADNIFSQSTIPEQAKIVFVADLFAEDYTGGAELTTQALIDSCPFEHCELRSAQVSIETLRQGADKFWIFGNFAKLNPQLIPTIVGNLQYAILEYDYKYCQHRSPEKHASITGSPCDCHNMLNGKIISAFYYGAKALWWMSEKQKERYQTLFPFLSEKDNFVLSSVFDHKTLGTIKQLRSLATSTGISRNKWIVLGSDSWIKGFQDAKDWCVKNDVDHDVVWNVPYDVMLKILSTAKGFVYLPKGGDTCPRMVIEAKLLGCELQINENVQHAAESWFNASLEEIEEYLYSAPGLFWTATKKLMDYRPTISGYTTTFNCIKQSYPFIQCIKSMLTLCDEVCIVDGGSDDGTFEKLLKMHDEDPRIRVRRVSRDWTHPRSALFDGMQKAEARTMCKCEFCWQMDSDEVIHEDDVKKVVDICYRLPKNVNVVSLPVIEYWGGPEKVRFDVTPWKWRLTRNVPTLTHGIPKSLRRYDESGELYAAPGTDGCDVIDSITGECLPHVSFYTQEADKIRCEALSGNEEARKTYERWFNEITENVPGVFHYSWYDLERKIRLYKDFWTRHWSVLEGKTYEDTTETNMMFDVPWSEVTDKMIEERAALMKVLLGGWVWHRKWDGRTMTPHITCSRRQPAIMIEECK